jgi:hypothetical protein
MAGGALWRSAVCADTNTFTPGPTLNTVRRVDGKILTAREVWVLLPPSYATLTQEWKLLAIIGSWLRTRAESLPASDGFGEVYALSFLNVRVIRSPIFSSVFGTSCF